MREAPPPYKGEGLQALWHVGEDDSIRRFEPHRAATAVLDDKLVWAIGTRLLPLYWFPRQCPRATFWAESATTDVDVERFLGGDRTRRVHVVELQWLERTRTQRVIAYRMPELRRASATAASGCATQRRSGTSSRSCPRRSRAAAGGGA